MLNKIRVRINQAFIIFKYFFVKIFSKLSLKKPKKIWLISERGDEARDNGYAFYKYMMEHHPEINFFYVIKKDSPDLLKIDPTRRVYYQSIKHIKYYINASYLLQLYYIKISNFILFKILKKISILSSYSVF